MAAVHPIEVLEKRLRDLLEMYESELGDAVDRVTERFSGKIERLVEMFGAQELEINLKYYPITVLPSLSDHFKSGQQLSLQNRPTGLAVQD